MARQKSERQRVLHVIGQDHSDWRSYDAQVGTRHNIASITLEEMGDCTKRALAGHDFGFSHPLVSLTRSGIVLLRFDCTPSGKELENLILNVRINRDRRS